MAKLWKKLPPLMADNFGFIEILNRTDGMGIIDDCSEYRTSAERHRTHRRSGESEMRVVHTEISSEDVTAGTDQKVLDTFARYRREFNPAFVLLSAGPCSAMIGTDLEDLAGRIRRDSGIKAAAVSLTGHKTYDVGISETLLAMVKLLTGPGEARRDGINLLGTNSLDWQEETAGSLRGWMEEKGFPVIAEPGRNEKSESLGKAAGASVNLAVTVSGLAAAEYLEKEYGIPYIAAAPFGRSWSEAVFAALKEGKQPGSSPEPGNQKPGILVIGEQLLGNAVRETLIRDYGMKNIQVCTFYNLNKKLAWPGDRRIRSEKEAERLIGEGGFDMIIGDPLLCSFAPEHCQWIDLPHKAFQLYGDGQALPLMTGENMNSWLELQMMRRRGTGMDGRNSRW